MFATAKRRAARGGNVSCTSTEGNDALTISMTLRAASKRKTYAVEQSRRKPMGRFRTWSVATLNKACEVVHDVHAVGEVPTAGAPLLTRLQEPSELVIALTGRQVGKLYDPSLLEDPSDVLTDAACVAMVSGIRFDKSNDVYTMRADPFTLSTTYTPKRKRRKSSGKALVPLLYTYISLFFERGTRQDGLVVFVDDARVELLMEDTPSRKVWYTLTAARPDADKLDRPVVTAYAMTHTPTDDTGGGFWTCDKRVHRNDTVDRLTYTLQEHPEDARHALHAYLRSVSVHGFTHVMSLRALRSKADDAPSDMRDEAVIMWGDAPTLECTALPSARTLPFSVTAQLDGKPNTVVIGLQLQRETYQPMLSARSADRVVERRTRQNVLLPTTHDLLHTHPLGASRCSAAQHEGAMGVVLALTSSTHDPAHAARCVLALLGAHQHVCRLERAVVLLDGVTRAQLQSKRPPTTVHVQVSRRDATTLTRVLCGQVKVTRAKTAPHSTRRTRINTPPARHWGRIGRSYVYHHKDYTPAWAHTMHDRSATAFFRPLVRVDVLRSRLPFPVCHVPLHASTGVRMPLHDRKYFPYHVIRHYADGAPYDRWGTLGGALPTVQPKPNGVIDHKVVLKNLSGNGERALFEIARSDNPTWFNVEPLPADDPHALAKHFTTDVHEPSMHVLREGVHAVVCDAHGRSHQMHYTKFPREDPMRVEPMAHADPSVRSAHADIDNQRLDVYGFSSDTSAQLSQLSHVLYGSTARYYRAANDTHQTKPTRVERLVDGYTPNACQLNGIVTLPRFVGVPTDVRYLWCVVQVGKATHNVHVGLTHGGTLHACCRALTRALRTTTRQTSFVAKVWRAGQQSAASIALTCATPFVLVDAGTLCRFGVASTTSPQTMVRGDPKRAVTLVPVAHDAAHLTRTSPTHHVRFAYVVANDTPEGGAALTYTVHADDTIDEPFHPADTCKLQTVVGRDGCTRFTSYPKALRVLAVAWVVPLARWVTVCGDGSVWVGETPDTLVSMGTVSDTDGVRIDSHTGLLHTIEHSYRLTTTQLNKQPATTTAAPTASHCTRDVHTGAWRVGDLVWTRDSTPLCTALTMTHVYVLDSAWHVYAHAISTKPPTQQPTTPTGWTRERSFADTFGHPDTRLPTALGVQQTGKTTTVVVGDTLGGLTDKTRVTTLPVSGQQLSAWYWQRDVTAPARALRVVVHGANPPATVTHRDCETVQLGERIADSVQQWWGFAECVTAAYSFDAPLVLHSHFPLTTHLRKHVMGYARTTPSEAWRTSVAQLSARVHINDAIDLDAYALAERYYGGRPSLHALPVADAQQVHADCAAHVARVRAWLGDAPPHDNKAPEPSDKAPNDKPSTNKAPTTHRTKPTPAAVRARFYYKVQRLLRTPDGVAYLQDTYAQSARFRKQFVGCCGFCENKFLYKVKTLRVDGCPYATKTWTDAWRDRFTDIGKGDVYHVCRRCGDQVCRQDGGLRTEYNASGGAMSSTHAEQDLDAVTSTADVRREAEAEAVTAVEQLQQERTSSHTHVLLRALDEFLDTEKVLLHRDTLLQLPYTPAVSAFLHKRKLRYTSPEYTHTLSDVVHHPKRGRDDHKHVLTVFQAAVRALKRVLARRVDRRTTGSTNATRTPTGTSAVAKMEASFVPALASIAPQLRLIGIAPRTYFRPRMRTTANASNTPQWNAVYSAIDRRNQAALPAIDWHARQDTSDLYAQNDVYVCIARDVADEVHGYTTLPDVLRVPVGSTSTVTRDDSYARTRFAVALPSRGLPRLLGRTLPLHGSGSDTVSLVERHVLPRTVNDVQRRAYIVAKLVHPTSSTLTYQSAPSFPHVLQMVLRAATSATTRRPPYTIPMDHTVLQLQTLVGIAPNVDLRRSVHPAALGGTRTRPPDWVVHWLQLDTTKRNEHVVKLVEGVRCVLGDAAVKHNGRKLMAAVLRKFYA